MKLVAALPDCIFRSPTGFCGPHQEPPYTQLFPCNPTPTCGRVPHNTTVDLKAAEDPDEEWRRLNPQ